MALDPTQTTMLRRSFATVGKKQYSQIAVQLNGLFQQMDGELFAIFDDQATPISFERGLRRIVAEAFGDLAIDAFVSKAYAKGIGRAFTEVRKAERVPAPPQAKGEFTRSVVRDSAQTFMNLVGQVQAEVRGINEELVRQVLREVVDGISRGETGSRLKARVRDRIDKIGKTRFTTLAHDTVIRAHAEGQLDAFQTLGITRVQAEVEWVTAADGKVCPKCRALGGLFAIAIDKARGLIPRHPRCRCAWKLVEVDRRSLRRKRLLSRKARGGLRKSVGADTGTQWPGANLL